MGRTSEYARIVPTAAGAREAAAAASYAGRGCGSGRFSYCVREAAKRGFVDSQRRARRIAEPGSA